jgi:DNA polymerase kappa
MSRGSPFLLNEQRKSELNQRRIQQLQQQIQSIRLHGQQELKGREEWVQKQIKDLEAHETFAATLVHLDMDAFYASVEERDRPDLKEKPMAVGGLSMLCTANYHARKFGVRAAMPGNCFSS